jgi:murein DD-endopeptidase MepM/ murein hydrolase activator NlpD
MSARVAGRHPHRYSIRMRDAPNRQRAGALARLLPAAALAAVLAVALVVAGGAPAQDLQSQLDQKRAQLDQAKQREGVLSTTIERYSNQIDTLAGQVATLRNREDKVQGELDAKQAELDRAQARLDQLRVRLHRSLKVLKERLVAIYKSDQPDVLTVILNSRGFDDLISRYEYLRSIQQQDDAIAGRVRDLRDATRSTVNEVRAARDALAAKRAELERTRSELEGQQNALAGARQNKQDALGQIRDHEQELDGDISHLEGQIQAQLQAAESSSPTLPAGPISGPSSAGFIWPVNGPVVSGYGWRFGGAEFHPGIDIAVPTGTPIRAAAAGTVALAGPNDGYGNYTCIEHGGGLSTCYAHQETISVSVGQHVSQGQVIGYSDCTGYCFGPHLHFEVRVNGSTVDPMGYL